LEAALWHPFSLSQWAAASMNRFASINAAKSNRTWCIPLAAGISIPLSVLATMGPAQAQQAQSSGPVALPAVDVQGAGTPAPLNAAMAPYQPPPADLGPLGQKQVLDTPQSINIIPQALIENQQAQTVNDTLRYLPSVEIRDQQGLEVSRPQSRGFQGSIVQNTRLDGLNYIGTTAIPA
jgi:iron complex outermembrane receptor protein